MAPSFMRFLDRTQRRTAVGRTSLDEWSTRSRDLYLTTRCNHKRQISMAPPPRANRTHNPNKWEMLQTYALDRAAALTGNVQKLQHVNEHWKLPSVFIIRTNTMFQSRCIYLSSATCFCRLYRPSSTTYMYWGTDLSFTAKTSKIHKFTLIPYQGIVLRHTQW